MKVGPSTCKRAGNGAHLVGDRLFVKDEIVGVYGGVLTSKPVGKYVLEIKNGRMPKFVDADPLKAGGSSFFGMMNEDLNEGEYNAELGEDGFIRILKECRNVELFTRYGPCYNWDALKQQSLDGLVEDLRAKFPTVTSQIPAVWALLCGDRSPLHRWIVRVVEGKIKATEKHGIHLGWKDDMRHLLAYLTYGPTCMKYNFRHWGHNVDETSIELLGKKRKALYTESWNGGDTVDGEIEMLFDTNSGNTHLCELTGKILSDLEKATDTTERTDGCPRNLVSVR
jgi:hypothetical protein